MDRRLFLLAGVAALFVTSCVSKPTMKLNHAQISSAGPAGIGMDVYMTVTNDNSFDVQVRNVRVQTTLQGRWTLPLMAYSPNQWLPAHGTTMVRAPVIIPWPLVGPLLAETAMSPTISYHVKGSADVTAIRSIGIKSDNYPVDENGTIPRVAVLQAARTMLPFAR